MLEGEIVRVEYTKTTIRHINSILESVRVDQPQDRKKGTSNVCIVSPVVAPSVRPNSEEAVAVVAVAIALVSLVGRFVGGVDGRRKGADTMCL